ncbi:MAG: hypothetical protein P4L40_03830 [Terracidiphilus sp.]|nr:hypothetical protein [Terracidiphilus sp.]
MLELCKGVFVSVGGCWDRTLCVCWAGRVSKLVTMCVCVCVCVCVRA